MIMYQEKFVILSTELGGLTVLVVGGFTTSVLSVLLLFFMQLTGFALWLRSLMNICKHLLADTSFFGRIR